MGAAPTAGAVRAKGQVRQATALVRAAVATCLPEDSGPDDAAGLTEALGALEKLVVATMVRYSRRVTSDAVGMLAGASGTTRGAARRRVETAERTDAVPALREALAAGELSSEQAAVIAPAAAAAPERAGALVETARQGSFAELRREADRTLQRARGEELEAARERRLHGRRYCKVFRPEEGGVRIDALLPAATGAAVLASLGKEIDALFRESRAAGAIEPRERLAADALVRLVTGRSTTSGAHLLVRVDAAALVRGELAGDEVCEIPGVGPVSVTTARSMLGDGLLTLLVTNGSDITTVTSTSRVIPRKVRMALLERDGACVVPGCGATEHLEIDHWRVDFARSGLSELGSLCRLCPPHHRLKTRQGWQLLGGPGRWRWLPPRISRRGRGPGGP